MLIEVLRVRHDSLCDLPLGHWLPACTPLTTTTTTTLITCRRPNQLTPFTPPAYLLPHIAGFSLVRRLRALMPRSSPLSPLLTVLQ